MPQPRPGRDLFVPLRSSPGGDPPPYKPQVPPEPDEHDRDTDDIPDTPGTEPPPVPIQDPKPVGAPTGPYVT